MNYFNERNEVVENYATSLYQVVKENNEDINDILHALDFFRSSVTHHEGIDELKKVLSYPMMKTTEKINLLNELFEGKINELIIRFVIELIKEQRIEYLDLIVEEFRVQYRKDNKILEVKATFGLEPIEEDITKIKQHIKSTLNFNEIDFVYEVDEKLIGGVTLFFNGKFIDNTLQQKIKRYANQISK